VGKSRKELKRCQGRARWLIEMKWCCGACLKMHEMTNLVEVKVRFYDCVGGEMLQDEVGFVCQVPEIDGRDVGGERRARQDTRSQNEGLKWLQ